MSTKSLMFSVVASFSTIPGFFLSYFLVFWPAAMFFSLLFGVFIATIETKYGHISWLDICAMGVGMFIGAGVLGSVDMAFMNQYFNNMFIATIVNAGVIPAGFLFGVGIHDFWHWIKRAASKQMFLSI
ncbi:MAG: hypothetical protein WD552_00635 [Candidatus Paceibacterota bacterium]